MATLLARVSIIFHDAQNVGESLFITNNTEYGGSMLEANGCIIKLHCHLCCQRMKSQWTWAAQVNVNSRWSTAGSHGQANGVGTD